MRNPLVIFDFDFTIAKTTESIWVWSPRGTRVANGKTYTPIHPTELKNIEIADDESIDEDSFAEFYDLNITSVTLIEPVMTQLKFYTEFLLQDVTILTARPQCVEEKVLKLLETESISVDRIDFVGLTSGLAKTKITFIKKAIKQNNISEVTIYEDNNQVLQLVKQDLSDVVKCNLVYIRNDLDKTVLNFYK